MLSDLNVLEGQLDYLLTIGADEVQEVHGDSFDFVVGVSVGVSVGVEKASL